MQMASLVAQMVKNLPAMQGIWVQLLDWEDPLEKGMANKSMQSTFPSVQLNEFLPSKLTSPDQEISIIRFQKSTQVKVKVKTLSRVRLFADPMDCSLRQQDFPGKST